MRVVTTADHALVRWGLRTLLEVHNDVTRGTRDTKLMARNA